MSNYVYQVERKVQTLILLSL